jgi:YHS domain-containing protein
MPCVAVFVKDPVPYLFERGVSVPCAVRPELAASSDPQLRLRINHENFLFSSADAKAAFLADPLRYIERLTDPVTRQRFQPDPQSPRLVYDDREWYFASAATRAAFSAEPERYAEPNPQAWMR